MSGRVCALRTHFDPCDTVVLCRTAEVGHKVGASGSNVLVVIHGALSPFALDKHVPVLQVDATSQHRGMRGQRCTAR